MGGAVFTPQMSPRCSGMAQFEGIRNPKGCSSVQNHKMAPGTFRENNLFVESEYKHKGIDIDALE